MPKDSLLRRKSLPLWTGKGNKSRGAAVAAGTDTSSDSGLPDSHLCRGKPCRYGRSDSLIRSAIRSSFPGSDTTAEFSSSVM